MEFYAPELISEDIIKRQSLFEDIINNMYDRLSTNYCEYVNNINNMYYQGENITKTFNSADNRSKTNFTENLQQYYNYAIKSSLIADKIKGFSGYVENFEDNCAKVENIPEVIHNNIKNSKNSIENISDTFQNYKYLTENIKNIENSQNYNNKSYGININMGGITQNISGAEGEDIMDILVDKLKNALSSCGEGIYY